MSNLLDISGVVGDYKIVSFSMLISTLNYDKIELPAKLYYDKQYSNMWSLVSQNKLSRYNRYKYSLMELSRRRYYNDLYDASLNDTKSLNLVSRKLSTLDNIQSYRLLKRNT